MSITHRGASRRAVLAGAASIPLVAILRRSAHAAEFEFKYATGQDPTHPVNIRAQEALNRISEATSGRLNVKLFPANQLGSDTDLLAQVRSGSVDFFNRSSLILATFVPSSGMTSLGFAFKDYETIWKTMDGALGNFIRADIAKTQIFAFDKIWDNGFRQITASTREIRTPEDLNGFKIRVPPAPPLTSLFKAMGAAPAPINFNELYSALQTKIVDGQENPLAIIATTRLYEVQKSCTLSGHVWDGYWVLANKRSFARLPADLQKIVANEINRSAVDQRGDIAKLSDSLKAELTAKGITFVDIDREVFRKALAGTSFYAEWRQKYGDTAWSILEKTVGRLG